MSHCIETFINQQEKHILIETGKAIDVSIPPNSLCNYDVAIVDLRTHLNYVLKTAHVERIQTSESPLIAIMDKSTYRYKVLAKLQKQRLFTINDEGVSLTARIFGEEAIVWRVYL